MIFQLVYVSSVGSEQSIVEVFAEIPGYRTKNVGLAITGMLLVKQGSFMQVLEGREAAVRSLYATIRADPRHEHVHTLATIEVPGRQFPDWSMGFADLDDGHASFALAERPLLDLPIHREPASWKASVAMSMLATFVRED